MKVYQTATGTMDHQRISFLFALLCSLTMGTPRLKADMHPIPVPILQAEANPYRFNGVIVANVENLGSGAVVRHPNIVLSCAHVPHDEGFELNPWLGSIAWFWRPTKSPYEIWEKGKVIRGYARLSGYQFASETYGDGYSGTFISDIVAYYAFEPLAGNEFGGCLTNGLAALKDSRPKMVTGYPSGLYEEGQTDQHLMHATGPFSTRLEVVRGSYLWANGVTTGSGNSGGPVWAQVSPGGWQAAGVLVSGTSKQEGSASNGIGVRALTEDAWALITEAIGAAPPPPNDNLASSLKISGVPFTVSGSNLGGSKELGEPDHAEQFGGKSVWWSWTAPSSQRVILDTVGSLFDPLLAVYTGPSVSNLTPVASDDGGADGPAGRVVFAAVAGVTYHIAVDAYASIGGKVVLNLSLPASNDNFDSRYIPFEPAAVTGSNVGASKQNGEPDHAGKAGGNSVWWSWSPSADGP